DKYYQQLTVIENTLNCYRRNQKGVVTYLKTECINKMYVQKKIGQEIYCCIDNIQIISSRIIIPDSGRTETCNIIETPQQETSHKNETLSSLEFPPHTTICDFRKKIQKPVYRGLRSLETSNEDITTQWETSNEDITTQWETSNENITTQWETSTQNIWEISHESTQPESRIDNEPFQLSECPPQTTRDNNGEQLLWPSIKIGETYFINGTNCIKAVATCSCELQLIQHSNWNADLPVPCYITKMNLAEATNQLQNLREKGSVTRKDLIMATAIINQALQTNRTVLSQSRVNATFIVQTLDYFLEQVELSPGETIYITHQQVSVYAIKADNELPQGIALTNVSENLLGSTASTFKNQSDILQEGAVDVAIFLSNLTSNNNSKIQFAFFNDDAAFIEKGQTINSRIISVNADTTNSVDILFKSWNSTGEKRCVFWDFNKNGGGWNDSGCELVPSPSKNHDMCRCTHLTHFAEIISPPGNTDPDIVLDVISLVGCSLSLLGLLGIFVTGSIFWQWRAQIGNKILLHLSAAIALNLIIFLIIATHILP
ncbi:hypothetical protein L9F63_014422, partial [Diploptera punctata]